MSVVSNNTHYIIFYTTTGTLPGVGWGRGLMGVNAFYFFSWTFFFHTQFHANVLQIMKNPPANLICDDLQGYYKVVQTGNTYVMMYPLNPQAQYCAVIPYPICLRITVLSAL